MTSKSAERFALIPLSVLYDKSLSMKARGLMCSLIVLPEQWCGTVNKLAELYGEGKHSTHAVLRELEAAGYIKRHWIRNENGTFKNMEYVVRPEETGDD